VSIQPTWRLIPFIRGYALILRVLSQWSLPLINYTYGGMNLDATVAYAADHIQQASDDGVGLLALPEVYFPGSVRLSPTFRSTLMKAAS
jgi:hypothetical protein